MAIALLVTVFVVATCGLVYELVAGALASYLLGDSITQFSTVIGVYLFAMGVGSFLSKYITRNLLTVFIRVELLVGLIGGTSAAILFLLFEFVASFRVLLYAEVFLIGTLIGLEIPLLMRILQSKYTFSELVSRVFTFDYVGALLASLLFPLVLVPYVGLVQTAFMFGLLNTLVALAGIYMFRADLPKRRSLLAFGLGVFFLLTAGWAMSGRLLNWAEESAYEDAIVYTKSTPYQRIVLTRSPSEFRLFLSGNLQFSSRDEYRYHEALVHPGLASITAPKRVLVLGGGDGLAVREILKYPSITEVVLVDLDAGMTQLFQQHPDLVRLNEGALNHPKVSVIQADAFRWISETSGTFDFIVCDFPDPSNFSLGKLYSTAFYHKVASRLAPGGRLVVQSTSPWVARKSFWCVSTTLEAVGFKVFPYHTHVPSFGEWGYVLASKDTFVPPVAFPQGLRFLTPDLAGQMFVFPPDLARVPTEPNRLNNQKLVHYFEQEWADYTH